MVDRRGEVVRGNRNPETGAGSRITPVDMAFGYERQRARFSRRASTATTLTVVLTDARLRFQDPTQLARQVHVSMARVETDVVPTAVGAFASELAWDAVLAAVT